MGSKARGGNVALKLNMMKAYDRVVWPFLLNVLRAFEFGEQWIDMVWRLIVNVWFSVVVNRSLFGFFKPAGGLRQGDPLSPALFIIGVEVLSRSLNSLPCYRGFQGFFVKRGCPLVTHLGYANDVLVFSSANVKSLKLLKRVLTTYEAVSGQRINAGKSCFLVHPKHLLPNLFSRSSRACLLIFFGELQRGVPSAIGFGGRICVCRMKKGVGLHQLEDVYTAFSIKLWWDLRANTSLWADFIQAKFCPEVHPNLVFGDKGSEVWRWMVKLQNIVERHIRWIVRSESSNFWFDNWLGSGGLSDRFDSVSDHKVVDFVQHATWDVRNISQWVPSEIVAEIVRVDPPTEPLPDLMIWRPEHLGVCMAAWWQGKQGNKFLEFIHQVTPLLICWHIWKARNGMKYDIKMIEGVQLCYCIFIDLLELFRVQFPECRVLSISWIQFYLEISSWNTAVSHMLVKWVRPSHEGLKLNMDGCSKGNPGVHHCYRQANQVADILANEGCRYDREEIYLEASALPQLARGVFHLDRLGVAFIHQIRRYVVRE
ncbi:uncharacterized protein [Coffea arabica]|uniref:Reverse transcriptase domain-containing protein n=1 Tax=Coffea arabica TaxID=13443 RepID=A0A6P6TEY2_COFAR